MNECSEKCKSCIYSVKLYMPTTEILACQYIIIEKKERNCECGEKCTKYKEGKRKNWQDYFRKEIEGEVKNAKSKRLNTI